MLEHLKGKFGGTVDSFYTELYPKNKAIKSDPGLHYNKRGINVSKEKDISGIINLTK